MVEYDPRVPTVPNFMTSPLAAFITPHGTIRTGFACAEFDTATMAAADSSRIATGATRLHFRHPAAAVELTVGEIRPRLPSQMTVLACWAGLWRVTAQDCVSTPRFYCEWPSPPPEAEGTPNPGEGLDAFTWRLAGSALSLGTEDGELLAARAQRDAGVPPRLARELTFSTVHYTDSGLVVPVSGMFPGEVIEVHFVVAWTDGDSHDSPSTWFAVDQNHKYVVQSLAGTGDRTG